MENKTNNEEYVTLFQRIISKIDKKTIFMVLEGIILITIIIFSWRYFSNKLDISDQNLKAAKGEVEVLKMKNNDLLYIRDSYVMKEKDLEEQLGITKDEVKELKKKLDSSLSYIAKLESEINTGEIVTVRDSIVYVTKELSTVPFHFNNNWMSIRGKNDLFYKDSTLYDIKTTINNINIRAKLKVGLSDNNKFFVETDNPYLVFESIEGTYLNNKMVKTKRVKFSYGFQLGLGVQYGLIKKNWDVGPYAGFGIGLSF